MDAIILNTIVILALYIVIKFAEKKINVNSTSLYANISDNNHRIVIQIAKLRYGSEQYKFTSQKCVDSIYVQGQILPRLIIAWDSLTVFNKATRMTVNVQLTAKLNPYDAFKLRRILKTEFDLLIFTRESTEERFKMLSLQGSQWELINLFRQSILRFDSATHESPPAYVRNSWQQSQ